MSTRPVKSVGTSKVVKIQPNKSPPKPAEKEGSLHCISFSMTTGLSATSATAGRENSDITSLDEAITESVSRARCLAKVSTKSSDSLEIQHIVRKIASCYDDWKQWAYEIGQTLAEENYLETAATLAGRCLHNFTSESDQTVLKLTHNLLLSLAQFSVLNSSFRLSAREQINILNDMMDFLHRSTLLSIQDPAKVSLVKLSLRLPLHLWVAADTKAWEIIEKKFFVTADDVQALPPFAEIEDDECRCLTYIWLLHLTGRNTSIAKHYCGNIRKVLTSLGQFLGTSLEKEAKFIVDSLVSAVAIAYLPEVLIQIGKSAAEINSPDLAISLEQLVENYGVFYGLETLQKARSLLTEMSPLGLKGKWKPSLNFQLTEHHELETAGNIMQTENEQAIAFLKKLLYQQSAASLVCTDAAYAARFLRRQQKPSWKEQSESWKEFIINCLLHEDFLDMAITYDKIISKRNVAKETLAFQIVSDLRGTVWDMARYSEVAAIKIAQDGYVDYLLDILKEVDTVSCKSPSSQDLYYLLLESTTGILYNVSLWRQVKYVFMDLKAAEILVPYLNPKFCQPVAAALCFANVVNDNPEASQLADEKCVLKAIVTIAGDVLRLPNRETPSTANRNIQFALSELLDGLCLLAINDSNKAKLMDIGILDLVKGLLLSSNNDENIRGIDIVWTLCFDADVKNEIATKHNDDVIRPLKNLAQPQVSQVVQDAAEKVVVFIEKWGKIECNAKTQPSPSSSEGHVFLSYSGKQQETVLLIRQELLNRNFKVWIDFDKMHGGFLDAMANKAIEDASIVLICFSSSYKESNQCRAEAQYVYSLGKQIVPVNMEYHYQADGWLGAMVRPLKYIDMSLKTGPFEKSMEKLLTEIKVFYNATEPSPKDVMPQNGGDKEKREQLEEPQQRRRRTAKPPKYAQWSQEDVAQWLRRENLHWLESKLASFDGKKLWGLLKISDRAPAFFYENLKQHVQASLPDLIELTEALDRLSAEE